MMVGLAGLAAAGGVGALGFEIIYFAVFIGGYFRSAFLGCRQKIWFCLLPARCWDIVITVSLSPWPLLSRLFVLIPYSAVQLAGVGYLLEGMTDGAITFTTGVVMATLIAVFFSYIAGIRFGDGKNGTGADDDCCLNAGRIAGDPGAGWFHGLFGTLEAEHPAALTVPGTGLFSLVTFLG